MLEQRLNRVTELATEVGVATTLHVRRIVQVVRTAVGRTGREVGDLVWDYSELAGDLRRKPGRAENRGDATQEHDDNVIFLDPRRRQAN
jgi:hypothetical protein